YIIDHMFEFDPRITKYEKICYMVDGKSAVVSIDPGTRIYREKGPEINLHRWIRDVQEAFDGQLIPYEWVADYVGVTRASLLKKIKKGNLTVLVFEMQEEVRGVLGSKRERMRREYKYVPQKECDGWRSDLIEKLRIARRNNKK
ncbi:hypothetical protein MNBD_PLANCTO02-489, partial [hydrothermal vent metagenome]